MPALSGAITPKLPGSFTAKNDSGEDVTHHKPHPEGISQALQALGVQPPNAIYVGDHPVDAQAAAAAQVPFIAVLTGVTGREVWASFAPRTIIETVGELPGVLSGVGWES